MCLEHINRFPGISGNLIRHHKHANPCYNRIQLALNSLTREITDGQTSLTTAQRPPPSPWRERERQAHSIYLGFQCSGRRQTPRTHRPSVGSRLVELERRWGPLPIPTTRSNSNRIQKSTPHRLLKVNSRGRSIDLRRHILGTISLL